MRNGARDVHDIEVTLTNDLISDIGFRSDA